MTIEAQEREHYKALEHDYYDREPEIEYCKICGKELRGKYDSYYDICSDCTERIGKEWQGFVESIMEGDLCNYKDCEEFLAEYVYEKFY